MSIQQTFYGVDGVSVNYTQTKYIANKQHCGVLMKRIDDDTWDNLPVADFDLQDNTIKLVSAISGLVYSQIEIRVVDNADELVTLDSLYADKTTLDSLFADKVALDSLFADKVTLDSLYADKATLDSLYADKATLDSLFADKATLDSLFADKATLDSLYADKATLDSIYADKVGLDAIYANLTEILLASDYATAAAASAIAADLSAQSISTENISATSVISNGLITSGVLALPTEEVTGSIPVLYTGNGISKDVPVHGGAIGSEEVTNGTFDTDTTGWISNSGGILNVSGGELVITGTGGDSTFGASQLISGAIDGTLYLLTIDIISTTGSVSVLVGTSKGQNDLGSETGIASTKTVAFQFIGGSSTYIAINEFGDGTTCTIDNVSVKEVSPLQIANDNGDGTTLAEDWVTGQSYDVDDIYIDNSTDGDALAYRLTQTDTTNTVSPRTNANWVLETNQYGGRFWFKNRDATGHNLVADSIRGEGHQIYTNLTNTESESSGTTTSFNPLSISVDNDAVVNDNAKDYVVWVDQTTRKTAGYRTDAGDMQNSKNNTGTDLMATDSAGNPCIIHYHPTTGFFILMDEGNGVAGTTKPHMLQNLLGTITRKQLTTTAKSWLVYNKISGATEYMKLETTGASASETTVWNDTEPTEDNFTVGSGATGNSNGEQYITYGQADSDNHYIGAYTGTGAVGNVVDFGLDMTVDGSYVMYKRLNSATNWAVVDNVRGDINRIFPNTSTAETFNIDPLITFTTTGIIVDDTAGEINASGGLYLIQAYSPKYNQPTGGSEITVNSGIDLTYTQGIGLTNLQETTSAHTVDLSAFAGDTAYILKERGSDARTSHNKIMYAQERGTISGAFLNTLTKTVDVQNFQSRASTATYVDGGVLKYAEIDEARFEDGDLLIESGSENICLYSQDFSNATWDKNGAITITQDTAEEMALDGTQTACKVTDLGEEVSINVKRFGTGDLVNIVVTDVMTGEGQRLSATITLASNNDGIQVRLFSNNSSNIFYIWGAQLEEQSSATSYIPTTTTAVTRAADIYNTYSTDLVALGECKVDTQGNAFDLVEYEPLQSYFNKIIATDDIETQGEFIGKNACTAWVNFDGTTTPPTIRDSFNVNDVVRTATGKYTIYFTVDMDNVNYSDSYGGKRTDTALGTVSTYDKQVGSYKIITSQSGTGTTYDNWEDVSMNILGGKS